VAAIPNGERLRFGIVQGRLIRPPAGQLQWFPQEHWEAEFFLASALGIDFVELIAERTHNPENPIWSDAGNRRILDLVARNGLSTHAFCTDYIIDHELAGSADVLAKTLELVDRGGAIGCEKFILPMFEHSQLTVANLESYVAPLRAIADRMAAYGIRACLETELPGADLIKALDRIDHPAVSVVFDTGNRAAFGQDLAADIAMLGDRISHVHIKDKNAANQNVVLGTGLVNFQQVFEALAGIGYNGPYTFETNRGKDPIRTAAYNIALVRYFHSEAFST
jgi:L-ribulose-5-phosphate 3-epimerase